MVSIWSRFPIMSDKAKRAKLILAFDPGRKKTGVAIGNSLTGSARPLATVAGKLDCQLRAAGELCAKWQPQLLIIGRPGPQSPGSDRYCSRFARGLQELTGIEYRFADEYLTSQLARSAAAKNESVDALAACLLAQDWLANPD